MRRFVFAAVLLVWPLAPEAQPNGACAPGQASAFLENAGVRAQLFGNGALFWRDDSTASVYEVPRGSGLHSAFNANLWVAGTVGGATRFAGSRYGPYEFWPGPLASDGGPPSAESCAEHDRLWRVTLADIVAYNARGETTSDLAEWPAHLGAPVLDGDGIADNYDLAAGDRPAILGDESVWWIMNDRGGTHDWGESPAVGLEVRVLAYTVSDAYARQRLLRPANDAEALHHATAYRYEVTYRGAPLGNNPPAALTNAHIGLYVDPDLGFFEDDYIGSAPDQNLGYVYNADRNDSGPLGVTVYYGDTPPTLGIRVLEGPGDKPLGCFMRPFPWSATDNTDDAQSAYQYMQCQWRDGSPLTYGGAGYTTGAPTHYLYPSLPPDFWSEPNITGTGVANEPGDRDLVLSNGPFTMEPGETVTFSVAMPWARSPLGPLKSVRELVGYTSPVVGALLKSLTPDPDLATLTTVPVLPPDTPTEPEPPARDALAATTWPNPASGATALRVDLAQAAHVRLSVFDALGREVVVPVNGPLAAAQHRIPLDVSGWAPGVYVIHLAVSPEAGGTLRASSRFVVSR